MNEKLKPYIPLCDAIAALFYPNVEVVLHDLKTKRLAHISNSFSPRRAGDKMLGGGEEVVEKWVGPYDKRAKSGQNIKAVTIILEDEKNKKIGMMCINHDLSLVKTLHETLGKLLPTSSKEEEPGVFFSQNWQTHIDERVDAFLQKRNISLKSLKLDEKRALVKSLDEEGVFTIRNGASYLSNALGVSRASIYNWLKQERKRRDKDEFNL